MVSTKTGNIIAGILAGLVAYAIIGKLGLYLLQISWADYAMHSKDKSYTLAMLLWRLLVGVSAAIAGGIAVAKVEKAKRRAGWIAGAIVFCVAGYIHLLTIVWAQYPVWYHFAFLLPIIPVMGLGHYFFRRKN